MQPAVLLALLLPSASASGGGGGGGGGDALSAECLSGFANATCSMVHHEIGFHPGERNGMVMSVNCEAANKLPTQTCSVSHECTTCSHYQCVWCSEDERSKIYVEPLGDKFLFLIVSLTAGAFISTLLEWMPRQTFHPPFTVVMFVLGMLMGMLAENNSLGCALSDSVNAWKHQDPHSILYALLPPLLFESAFNVNYHVFTKVMKSSILLATTGVLTSTFLTGCVGMWFFSAQFDRIQYENPACSMFGEGNPLDYAHAHGEFGVAPPKTDGLGNRDELGNCILDDLSGDHRRLSGGSGAAGSADGCYDCSMDGWWASFMFGAIVSATDPVAVVAVLQTLGAQPKLSHMIEGESLLNDGSAVVIFLVFKGLLLHEIQESGTSTTIWKMVALVARLGGGGVVVGAAFSYIVYAWLRISRNMTANIEISVMVLSVYLVFYIAEHVFGASGVLATVVYGLSLAKRKHLAMTVQTEEQNEVVWQEIGYVANSFTFALAGVILWRIVTKSLGDDSHDDRFQRGNQLLLAVGLYFILALIRLFAIFLHYHAMRAATKGGYKVQVKVRNTLF
jgi:NhaP-type Na+/H+ or K+/H+ antiporter